MAQFGGKNTAWNRNPPPINPQIFTSQLSGMNAFTVSQAAALQSLGAGLTVGTLGGGVIPAVNAAAFTTPQAAAYAGAVSFQAFNRSAQAATAALVAQQQHQQQQAQQAQQQQQQVQQQQQKSQRAFIGTITKLFDQYGFVDDDVFFKTEVVRGSMPRIGDKVMVEAAFNSSMPFKWNAFRIQLLPNQEPPAPPQHQQQIPSMPSRSSRGGGDDRWTDRREPAIQQHYAAPPRRERSPPPPRRSSPPRRISPPPRRPSPGYSYSNSRRRSPSPPPPASRMSSSYHQAAPSLKREHSPVSVRRSPLRSSTGASRSPPRRRARVTPRYNVLVPKFPLETKEAAVFDLRKRYSDFYIPSDFFHAKFDWTASFPMHHPLSLDHTVTYHIMHKEVDDFWPSDVVADPPDADYRYSAKVMLLSLPSLQEIYKKSIGYFDGKLQTEDFEPIHPHKLIQFLIGIRGKNEFTAIGGPWSPSLDGQNPENDPRVLIKTAIRTCKTLTGVDLSGCSQWYKFMQVRYRRGEKEQQQPQQVSKEASEKGQDDVITASSQKAVEPRADVVTIFVPDTWSVMPTKLEFENLQTLLKNQLETKLSFLDSPRQRQKSSSVQQQQQHASLITAAPAEPAAAASQTDSEVVSASTPAKEGQQQQQTVVSDDSQNPNAPMMDQDQETKQAEEETTTKMDDVVAESQPEIKKPTHWSNLDIKSMKVIELRNELDARKIDSKGIKSQLVSKLMKAVKDEQEAEAANSPPSAPDTQETQQCSLDLTAISETSIDDMNMLDKSAEEITLLSAMSLNNEQQYSVVVDTPVSDKEKSAESDKEAKKRKEREEREKRDRKRELEKHYVLPSLNNPGIFVFPSKTAKGGKFECKVTSLHTLLDNRQDCNKEYSFEVALFAETFSEMLLRDSAFNFYKVLTIISEKSEDKKQKNGKQLDIKEEKDDKKSNEGPKTEQNSQEKAAAAAKSIDVNSPENNSTASGEKANSQDPAKSTNKARSRDSKDEKKNEVTPTLDPNLILSLSFFDLSQCGYLYERDAEEILFSTGLYLTRAQIQKLLKKVVYRDTINYRKYAEMAPFNLENETLGNFVLLPWYNQHRDSGVQSLKSISERHVTTTDSNDVMVSYQGKMVDIGKALQQLQRLEKEQKNLEQRHTALENDLKNSKEQREILEKKKRRLEEDVRDYKKRLYDTEKCLKNSHDDTVQFKTALQRCKEWGEHITRLVDKTLPKRSVESEGVQQHAKHGSSGSKSGDSVKDEKVDSAAPVKEAKSQQAESGSFEKMTKTGKIDKETMKKINDSENGSQQQNEPHALEAKSAVALIDHATNSSTSNIENAGETIESMETAESAAPPSLDDLTIKDEIITVVDQTGADDTVGSFDDVVKQMDNCN